MNRRHFLRNGSLTGFTLSAFSLESFLSPAAGIDARDRARMAGQFPLQEVTIDELQQKMSSGEYTSNPLPKCI